MKDSSSTSAGLIIAAVYIVVILLIIVTNWKIFSKAGKPGWAAIIPIYNLVILFQIIQRPIWWILLFFVPIVNLIISVIMSLDLAKAFGKSEVFGIVGLFLFPIVGYPMLAFGSSKYVGRESSPTPPTPAPQTPPVAPPQQTPPPAPVA